MNTGDKALHVKFVLVKSNGLKIPEKKIKSIIDLVLITSLILTSFMV